MTYEEKIDNLDWGYSNSVHGVVVSEFSARQIAKAADEEIQKLKDLLDDCRWLLSDTKCASFIEKIEEVLKDE